MLSSILFLLFEIIAFKLDGWLVDTYFHVSGIAVLFLASWLPLSLFSLFADILFPPDEIPTMSTETIYLILAFCHLIAMTSAVSNPIVYGFLNANIRYEFLQLCASRCTTDYMSQNNGNADDQTTTKTMLATSTQRKSGPVTLPLKSTERSDRTASPPIVHIDSFMLWWWW
jgi:neuropeptide Y receptor